jgi:hypothetical protein
MRSGGYAVLAAALPARWGCVTVISASIQLRRCGGECAQDIDTCHKERVHGDGDFQSHAEPHPR